MPDRPRRNGTRRPPARPRPQRSRASGVQNHHALLDWLLVAVVVAAVYLFVPLRA